MNAARVASLLRELAEALESPAEPKRPRRLNVAPPDKAPSPEARALVQRTLRRKGLVRG